MEEVKASCNYGVPIVIDQCLKCGGVWFDEDELYRAKHGTAASIEKNLDVWKLKKETLLSGGAKCPRDGAVLKAFKNNYFKGDLEIDICPRCEGIWLNYGKFSEWQNHKFIKSVKGKNKEITLDEAELLALEQKIQKQATALVEYHSMLEREKRQFVQGKTMSAAVYFLYMILRIIFTKGR